MMAKQGSRAQTRVFCTQHIARKESVSENLLRPHLDVRGGLSASLCMEACGLQASMKRCHPPKHTHTHTHTVSLIRGPHWSDFIDFISPE